MSTKTWVDAWNRTHACLVDINRGNIITKIGRPEYVYVILGVDYDKYM